MVQVRAEGPKAPSPGHRLWYDGNQQDTLPVRAKALCSAWSFKAFALTIIFALGKINFPNFPICYTSIMNLFCQL